MPKRPGATFTVSEIQVEPQEPCLQIRTGPGTAAPSRFLAQVETAHPGLRVVLDIRIADGGVPVVEALGVYPGPGTALTSTTLRGLLLDPVVRAAVKKASQPVSERPDVGPHAFQLADDEATHQAWVSPPPGTDERVLRAAQLYREALAVGSRAPAAHAAEVMALSRPQIARYIRRARAAGLLPPVEEVIRHRAPAQDGPAPEPESRDPGTRMPRMTDPSSW